MSWKFWEKKEELVDPNTVMIEGAAKTGADQRIYGRAHPSPHTTGCTAPTPQKAQARQPHHARYPYKTNPLERKGSRPL